MYCTPHVATLPDQAPNSEQLVALLADQDRRALCPFAIVVGLATSDTVGADGFGPCGFGVGVGAGAVAVTDTVTELDALPPAPVQVIEYVEVLVGDTDCTPHLSALPDHAPDSKQLVALLDDQDSLALCPTSIVVGLAPSDIAGSGVDGW